MTPDRFRKLRETLEKRQPDLTVLLENVHKPHNFSAILRTCDAVGVLEAHAVRAEGSLRTPAGAAGGTRRWVGVTRWRSLERAVEELRRTGHRLIAAHPADDAVDYRDVDYTTPTAILFGQELDGLSDEALAECDERVVIPMMGFVASLNVSVAAALVLFEAQRQRNLAGLYDERRLDPERFRRILFEWTQPKIAEICRSRGLDYPDLDENGRPIDWRYR